jgi:hypothetical protein
MVENKFKPAIKKPLLQRIIDLGISANDVKVINGGEEIIIDTPSIISAADKTKTIALLKEVYNKEYV